MNNGTLRIALGADHGGVEIKGAIADFLAKAGNKVVDFGTDSEYQRAVFETFPGLLRSTFLWPTLGNHDAPNASVYHDLFTLPANGESGGLASGTEAYYSFDWGDIHFVCLDSTESDRGDQGPMMTWRALVKAKRTPNVTVGSIRMRGSLMA